MGLLDMLKRRKVEGTEDLDNTMYLTLREERRISRENRKIMKQYEREKQEECT